MDGMNANDIIYYVGRNNIQDFAEETIARKLDEREMEMAIGALEHDFMLIEQGIEEFIQHKFGERNV